MVEGGQGGRVGTLLVDFETSKNHSSFEELEQ